MKIYKYEFREFSGNQHSYESRATHTQHYLIDSKENRESFQKIVGKNACWNDGYNVGYQCYEIDVIE